MRIGRRAGRALAAVASGACGVAAVAISFVGAITDRGPLFIAAGLASVVALLALSTWLAWRVLGPRGRLTFAAAIMLAALAGPWLASLSTDTLNSNLAVVLMIVGSYAQMNAIVFALLALASLAVSALGRRAPPVRPPTARRRARY